MGRLTAFGALNAATAGLTSIVVVCSAIGASRRALEKRQYEEAKRD